MERKKLTRLLVGQGTVVAVLLLVLLTLLVFDALLPPPLVSVSILSIHTAINGLVSVKKKASYSNMKASYRTLHKQTLVHVSLFNVVILDLEVLFSCTSTYIHTYGQKKNELVPLVTEYTKSS